jgi:transposase-like protein
MLLTSCKYEFFNYWKGRWHLFYQAYPPEDPRQHWGHAVSGDLIHWRDLPYAIYPNPERCCFSGATLVEEHQVIAMYHGTKDGAYCPYCASMDVSRKCENDLVGRWNCHDCHASFRVTQGTLFQGMKISLQKWFLAITLMHNAKKSLSSHQLARDLNLNQKTV